MNERIIEIATKAGFVGDSMHPIFGTCQETALNNFAELIIEECIAQCWTVSEIENKGWTISECSKRIRKHFGVKS